MTELNRTVDQIESDENFLDWMLQPEVKMLQFQEIKEQMKREYLNEPFDWICTFSGGKDSSLVLKLVWEMLESLPPEQRHKRVHVVSSDTLVETNTMTKYLHASLEMIAKRGERLGIEVHLVQPRMIQRYFRHVIGLGVIPPAPGRGFSWCTDRLKIQPMNEKMAEIMKRQPILIPEPEFSHRLTILLGVRLDESSKRARSVRRHTGDDVFGDHDYVSNSRVYHPIKYVDTFDLWNCIKWENTTLPWGMPIENLEALYGGGISKECPVIRSKKELNKSCGGNSRNGCWVCLMGGREDKMLQELIDGGDQSVTYLAEWKAFLYDVTFDVRYKDPIKGMKMIEKRLHEYSAAKGFLDDNELWYKNDFDRYLDEYQSYERAFKGNAKGEYDPGKFSFDMRRMLLEKLFYAQEMAGYQLISTEEVKVILEEWKKEGFQVTLEELQPINHSYDGAVVLRRDWSINEKETTNKNPVFFVEVPMNLPASELAVYHKERQRLTGRSIFCFYEHTDLQHMKAVFNKATFLVCQQGITTLKEASEYVHTWLYLEGNEIVGENGQPFTKMTDNAIYGALNTILLDSLMPSLSRLDNELIQLKEDPKKVEALSKKEQETLNKKWTLFQRWIRPNQCKENKFAEICNVKKDRIKEFNKNKNKNCTDASIEHISLSSKGQLVFNL